MKSIKILGIITTLFLIIIIIGFALLAVLGVFSFEPEEKLPEGIVIEENKTGSEEIAGEIFATIKTEKGEIKILLANCAAAEKFIELDNSGVFANAAFEILAEDMFIQTGTYGEAFAAEKNSFLCEKGAVGFVLEEEKAYPSIVIITGENLFEDYKEKILVFGKVSFGFETVFEIEKGENSGYTGGFSAAEPVAVTDIEISYPTKAN